MSGGVVTPAQVEQKLIQLSRELDEAHEQLEASEYRSVKAETDYEIGIAEQRMRIGQRALEAGRKVTVQEKEDEALVFCADLYTENNFAGASVRVARANARRLSIQIDITRSVGTAVRAALDL